MIGERVKHARLYHGWTQQQLASLIDVTQPAVYQIEATGNVSEANLSEIARVTDFALWWFHLGPLPDLPDGSLRFRKRANASKRDAMRIRAYARHTIEAVERLSQGAELPPVRVISTSGGEFGIAEIEDWAAQARQWLGVGSLDPIPNLTKAIERSGIFVLSFAHELEKHDAVSFWPEFPTGRPFIFFSRGYSGDRQRFSIAHELGHLCLHQTRVIDAKTAEREANSFAAALLFPRESALEDLGEDGVTLRTLAYIKARWGVSIKSLIHRAADMGVIDADRRVSLEKQYNSRGWARQEPVMVQEEQPTLMRKLMIVTNGPDAPRRVKRILGLPSMASRELVA